MSSPAGTANTASIVGRVLDGRYRVDARLASGGMATVFTAVDTRLDRQVAVKVLDSDLARDPGFERRFVREAKAAARLSHPNVVAVYDQGRDGDTLFLVMELIHGRTLRQLLTEHGRLPTPEALRLTGEVLAALTAAHRAGLVHRDIKPENVLLDEAGQVKVADFGLARAVASSEQSTTRGVVLGTVSYLAPEQVERGPVDERTDVYATGILTYELLTGERPYEGDNPLQVAYQHVHSTVPAPSSRVPDLPAAVDRLIATATAREPDDRYPDAATFAARVKALAATPDAATPDAGEPTRRIRTQTDTADLPERHDSSTADLPDRHTPGAGVLLPPPGPPPRRRRRHWPLVLLVLLVVLVGGSGAGYAYLLSQFTQAPEVTGLTLAKARQQAGRSDLSVHRSRTAYSETVAAGHIISAEPVTGERVRKHTPIDVVVSKGPERYDVPELAGKTADQAKTLLTARHLALGGTTGRYDEHAPTGTVLASHPDAGTPEKRGTAVDLVLSKGRRPIEVPSVVGKDGDAAAAAITQRHLKVSTSKAFSRSVPAGQVISQKPADGTLFRGDTVHLVVSKGPQMVRVPSVRGHGVDDAVAQLVALGLKPSVQHAQLYVGAGLVVGESPGGNEVVPKGTTVVLTIV